MVRSVFKTDRDSWSHYPSNVVVTGRGLSPGSGRSWTSRTGSDTPPCRHRRTRSLDHLRPSSVVGVVGPMSTPVGSVPTPGPGGTREPSGLPWGDGNVRVFTDQGDGPKRDDNYGRGLNLVTSRIGLVTVSGRPPSVRTPSRLCGRGTVKSGETCNPLLFSLSLGPVPRFLSSHYRTSTGNRIRRNRGTCHSPSSTRRPVFPHPGTTPGWMSGPSRTFDSRPEDQDTGPHSRTP